MNAAGQDACHGPPGRGIVAVMRFLRKVGGRVAPPGLEQQILRKLPRMALVATAIPLLLAVLARLTIDDGTAAEIAKQIKSVDIFCIASLITIWTAVLTVGIGCVVVYIMKGPAYAADSYEVSHSDRPRK